MAETATISFKTVPERKAGAGGKFIAGILILAVVFAGYFYWRHFNSFKGAETTKAASATTAIAPKADSAFRKSAPPATIKATLAGFIGSVVNAFSPSAKAATIQPEMLPASKPAAETVLPAKRTPLPTVAAATLPVSKPKALTAEQMRLKVAQDSFDDILTMAVQHPDAYGFLPDESLSAATLGKEIPVYTIALQGRDKFAKQPVSSLLKPANEWVYPVMLGNHVRYMVSVQLDGTNYVAQSSSRSLGTAYDKILARWPAKEGFHPQLITVPNLPFYYFSIPELPDQNITDTARMLDYNPDLSPASIVLANCQ